MTEHTLQHQFEEIYQEMSDRNTLELESKGTKIDGALNQHDQRKGIGIFAYYDATPSQEFERMYQEADLEFPDQVLYSPLSYHPRAKRASFYVGQLHFTFFQVHAAASQIPSEYIDNLGQYAKIIAECLLSAQPFQIEFRQLMAIPSGLLIAGTPTEDINLIRENIRRELTNCTLPLNEPYKSDIAHSTFLRLANPLEPERLLNFAARYKDANLGTLQVSKLQLGLGSWRMAPSEVTMKYEFDLQNKKLIQM